VKTLFRNAAVALVLLLAALAVDRCFIIPYRCNIITKQVTDAIRLIGSIDAPQLRAAELARNNAQRMQACVASCPENVAAAMDLAACYRILGQHQKAIAAYNSALRVDRRPELYLNLGQAQIEAGDKREGLQNLITACLYNPALLDEIGEQQPEVREAVGRYQIQLEETARHSR